MFFIIIYNFYENQLSLICTKIDVIIVQNIYCE